METGSSSGSITIHNASIFITCLGRWMTDCSRDITLVKRNGHDEIVPSVTHKIYVQTYHTNTSKKTNRPQPASETEKKKTNKPRYTNKVTRLWAL